MPPTIVLLNPPGRRIVQRDWYDGCAAKGDYLWPPVNLLIQSGMLSAVGDVRVVDAIADRLDPQSCMERVAELRPDLLLLLTGSASWEEDLAFGRAARERTGATLVGHGDAFTFEPRAAMERWPFVDVAFYDFASGGLARWIAAGRPAEGGDDLMVRGADGELSEGPWRRGNATLDYPTPLHERFPLAQYRMPFGPVEPLTAILTNYGCPHGCRFCNKPSLGYRVRPRAAIEEELDRIAALGVRRLFVADMTFNVSKTRVLDVCDAFGRASAPFTWSAYARPDHLDREQVHAMRRAGAIALHFGVESGDGEVLAENGKPMDVGRVREAFELCRAEGLLAGAHFIVGLPGETAEGLKRSVALASSLAPDFASVNVAMPRMGTALRAGLNGSLPGTFARLDSSSGEQPVHLSAARQLELARGRRRLMRTLYFRPRFLLRHLRQLRSGAEAMNLFRNGMAVIRSYAQ